MKIGLVSCAKTSKDYPCTGVKMYSDSVLFKAALNYCREHYDLTYILSAKYGLVGQKQIIHPYNEELRKKSIDEIREWSRSVYGQLKNATFESFLENEYYFHTGLMFRCFLMQWIPKTYCPVENMTIGKRLQFYKQNTRQVSGQSIITDVSL